MICERCKNNLRIGIEQVGKDKNGIEEFHRFAYCDTCLTKDDIDKKKNTWNAFEILSVVSTVLVVGLILALVVSIISSKNKYNDLAWAYEDLTSTYDSLNTDYNNLNSMYSGLRDDKIALESEYETLQSNYDELASEYLELYMLYQEEVSVTIEEPQDLSEYSTDITYDNLARTPDDYLGKAVCFTGKVVQLIEGEDENQLRVAINSDYDKIILIGYDPKIMSERILEDDKITFYGISYGIITYESTIGGMVSVPAVYADYIEIN